jgi:arsenate reductase
MAEIGIDISGQHAKGINAVDADSFDVVVTLCAEADCPVLPSVARRLHWPIDDPAAHPPNAPPEAIRQRFRHARDALIARLGGFAADVGRGANTVIPSHGGSLAGSGDRR